MLKSSMNKLSFIVYVGLEVGKEKIVKIVLQWNYLNVLPPGSASENIFSNTALDQEINILLYNCCFKVRFWMQNFILCIIPSNIPLVTHWYLNTKQPLKIWMNPFKWSPYKICLTCFVYNPVFHKKELSWSIIIEIGNFVLNIASRMFFFWLSQLTM